MRTAPEKKTKTRTKRIVMRRRKGKARGGKRKRLNLLILYHHVGPNLDPFGHLYLFGLLKLLGVP
jgi:hypothetical protein